MLLMKKKILQSGELWLAVEGRYTNLRIWTGRDVNGRHPLNEHDTVFMRLDKANEYSTPLSEDSFFRLSKKGQDAIRPLLRFGFKCSINNIDEILSITDSLPIRKHDNIVEW